MQSSAAPQRTDDLSAEQMNEPLVSVIIPTYNRSQLVIRAIRNALDQTYKNTEIVIVDDGSTDDTQHALRSFGDRIRVIRQANRGPSSARNRGLEIAQGEIIAFQDSDDLWMATKLERQVSLLERAGPSVPCCICNAEMHFAERSPTTSFKLAAIESKLEEGIWVNVAEVLATTFILFNQCAAIRRDALARVGGFDESLTLMEDYDYALRLALDGGSWIFTSEPLVVWRQGSPESLFEKARAEELRMRECVVRCLEVFDRKVHATDRFLNLRRLSQFELQRRRRDLAIARLEKSSAVGARSRSWALKTIERYRRALRRKLGYAPAMSVIPLNT